MALGVSPRLVALTAGAAVILGGLVYLFVMVRSEPASTNGPSSPPEPGSLSQQHPRLGAARSAPEVEPDDRPAPESAEGSGSAATHTPPGIKKEMIDKLQSRASGLGGGSGDPGPGPDPAAVDPKRDAAMDEANKLYDQGDYEAAQKQALRVLEQDPKSVRMRRIVVSSACMGGDADTAHKHYGLLPAKDQADMAKRCERYGISFQRPSQPQ